MAVDDARELGVTALQQLDVDQLLDQLGRLRADDVAAQQLAVALVADDLDQAAAVAVDRAGADSAVLDLADGDVMAGLARLSSVPDDATLGLQKVARGMSTYSIGCVSRPAASSTAMIPSSEALSASAGPRRGRRWPTCPWRSCAARRPPRSPVLAGLDAGLVEAETFDVGAAPGRDDEPVGLAGLALEGEGAARVAGLDVLHQRAGMDLDPLFLAAALGGLEMSASSVGSTRSSASRA